uniref:Uncharacterized protein n=1 Tax=Faxonius propinquus nudivirus TaxID=3139431 RepID=A0AAU8GFN2_9VIRU
MDHYLSYIAAIAITKFDPITKEISVIQASNIIKPKEHIIFKNELVAIGGLIEREIFEQDWTCSFVELINPIKCTPNTQSSIFTSINQSFTTGCPTAPILKVSQPVCGATQNQQNISTLTQNLVNTGNSLAAASWDIETKRIDNVALQTYNSSVQNDTTTEKISQYINSDFNNVIINDNTFLSLLYMLGEKLRIINTSLTVDTSVMDDSILNEIETRLSAFDSLIVTIDETDWRKNVATDYLVQANQNLSEIKQRAIK